MFKICEKYSLSLSLSRLAFIFIFSLVLISCGGGGGGGNNPASSTSKQMTAFGFKTPASTGIIDESAKTVTVTVPYGTDVTSLASEFTTTGIKTTVNGVEQISGATTNNFSGVVTYRVTAEDGSFTDYNITVNIAPAGSKDITAFSITGQSSSDINGTDITVIMPYGTVRSSLVSTITHTGAGISPEPGIAQDYTNPLKYTVTAADGSKKEYTVTVNVAHSNAKEIAKFTILGIDGTISGTNISLTVPFGTGKSSLVPTVLHTGAGISPTSGTAQDFTNPLKYTVTAADGSKKEYTVTVNVAPSDAKEITKFTILGIDGTISGTNISLAVPFGTGKISLVPTVIHTGEGISPTSGTARDFTNPLKYTVTAADGSKKEYTVTVNTWVKTFGGVGDDYGHSMCIDSIGNIYITGQFSGSIDFGNGSTTSNGDSDIFIIKYSPERIIQWIRTIGGAGADYGTSICIDSDNNVYVTGNFSVTVDFDIDSAQGGVTSKGSSDMFLVKFTSDGLFQWVNTIGGTDIDGGLSVCLNTTNNIYVAGAFRGIVDFDGDGGNAAVASKGNTDIFIAKYTTGGIFQSVKTIGGTANDVVSSISSDLAGNIYITGLFNGTGTVNFGGFSLTGSGAFFDVFIAKYSSAEVCLWAKKIGGTGQDIGNFICSDSSGNVYVTGYFQNTVDFGDGNVTSNGGTDFFLVKYDTDGSYLWANAIGGTGDDDGISLCLDSEENVYLAGSYNDTVDFDGDGETGTVVSNGGIGSYIAKFSSDGIYDWVKTIGGTGYVRPGSIVADSSGKIYVTGVFESTVNFNDGDVTSSGGADVFLINVLNE